MRSENLAVLLPVYKKDKPDYLDLAIKSVLNQSHKSFILYIGIDGPIPDSLKEIIAASTYDYRVCPVWFNENRGLAVVLNDLFTLACDNGACFFARMDADDISLPDRFDKQLNFLYENKTIDVVGGAISEIYDNGLSRNKVITYPRNPDECRKFFSKRNPHAHPAVMFRKSFFDKIGHCYRPEYRQNQDTMLWFDGFLHGCKNANIKDQVLQFRMTDNLFKKRRNGWQFAKKQLKDRLDINRQLDYGFGAYVFGYAMFILQLSPVWLRKWAYRIFR